MSKHLFVMGVSGVCLSVLCLLITQAYPPEFYASLMALIASLCLVGLSFVTDRVVRRLVERTARPRDGGPAARTGRASASPVRGGRKE